MEKLALRRARPVVVAIEPLMAPDRVLGPHAQPVGCARAIGRLPGERTAHADLQVLFRRSLQMRTARIHERGRAAADHLGSRHLGGKRHGLIGQRRLEGDVDALPDDRSLIEQVALQKLLTRMQVAVGEAGHPQQMRIIEDGVGLIRRVRTGTHRRDPRAVDGDPGVFDHAHVGCEHARALDQNVALHDCVVLRLRRSDGAYPIFRRSRFHPATAGALGRIDPAPP